MPEEDWLHPLPSAMREPHPKITLRFFRVTFACSSPRVNQDASSAVGFICGPTRFPSSVASLYVNETIGIGAPSFFAVSRQPGSFARSEPSRFAIHWLLHIFNRRGVSANSRVAPTATSGSLQVRPFWDWPPRPQTTGASNFERGIASERYLR